MQLTPRHKRASAEGEPVTQERLHLSSRETNDPIEKEVRSCRESLTRVASHESTDRTLEADAREIVRAWKRAQALLELYRPVDWSLSGIANRIAVGLAGLGLAQVLTEEQSQEIHSMLSEHKHMIEFRLERFLDLLSEDHDEDLADEVLVVRSQLRPFYASIISYDQFRR